MYSIQSVANDIATGARMAMDIAGVADVESAINVAAQSFIDDAARAQARTGAYRYETSPGEIEFSLFRGSVARDVLDNTFRPSTGPIRDYVIAAF